MSCQGESVFSSFSMIIGIRSMVRYSEELVYQLFHHSRINKLRSLFFIHSNFINFLIYSSVLIFILFLSSV